MQKIIYALSFFILFSCTKGVEEAKVDTVIYQTGAEYVNGEYLTDSIGFSEFTYSKHRSNEFSRTGKYCIKLDSLREYGFNLKINNPKKGELYQVSVWQKKEGNSGSLVCKIKGKTTKNIRTYMKDMRVENGWINHKLSYLVRDDIDELIFYVFSGGETTYFDDMSVKRITSIPKVDNKLKLNLYIPTESKNTLLVCTERAIKDGVISKRNKVYVKAFILTESDSIPIKMRLKGDWIDHLTTGKPSYRIKVKGDYAFNGLKTFSIQHPKTRNFLNEWFMHKWCDKEDLLSTSYDFLPVEINGENKGVYAIEEHFDKQLLESKNRREGVIFKIAEDGLWGLNFVDDALIDSNSFPYYKSSHISFFKKKRTLKSTTLKKQLIEGTRLMTLMKELKADPSEYLDLKKTAKYYAILELGQAPHANNWHNRRYYFNPITQQLENIGFDMLAGTEVDEELLVVHAVATGYKSLRESRLDALLYKNKEFRAYFMEYLALFTSKKYLDSLYSELKDEIKEKESLLSLEFNEAEFFIDFYYKRATHIKNNTERLIKLWDTYMKREFGETSIRQVEYKPNNSKFYLEEISVNAYVSKNDSISYKLELQNFHLNKIDVLGYKTKKDSTVLFDKSYSMKGFIETKKADELIVNVDRKPKSIVFRISNNPSEVYSKKVFKWEKPKGVSSRMKLKQKFDLESPYYDITDDSLVFSKGALIIDKLIYIPARFKVFINKETTIDFVNGGGLVINNDFKANGTRHNPIIITSTDKINHGITVLKASSVEMNFVEFNNLNSLHYKKWNLTGAVTIYESETNITNCKITNNICEDGLNIIRSNFAIDSLIVKETKSDGFDADFCTGIIKNSYFENTGNDCIDFSGSEIRIEDIKIINSGDKGISGGEGSDLMLNNINIKGAITGVAAKDGTKIKGNNIFVTDAEYGVAVFRKKPEYGGASIDFKNIEYSNLKIKALIERGSFLKIEDETFYGFEKLNIEGLYARFEKK